MDDAARLEKPHATPAIFTRDQRAEVAGCRQGGDEGFRVSAALVQIAPVVRREPRAQLAQRRAQRWIRFRLWHTCLPRLSNTRAHALGMTSSGGRAYSTIHVGRGLCERTSRAVT